MKSFDRDHTAFGRHETFSLRYGWLTKGIFAVGLDEGVFETDDAVVTLGVGKNMVSSIRYWLQAAQLVRIDRSGIEIEDIGRQLMIQPGWDSFLEDDASLWLLHWLICSNAQDATAFFWFFNSFHKSHFNLKELGDELLRFAQAEVGGRFSVGTLKSDISVLTRSYSAIQPSDNHRSDDALDCPFSDLGLVHQSNDGRFVSQSSARPGLPPAIIGFAVMQIFNQTGKKSIPVADLMRSDGAIAAPGSVFRLTEDALLEKLEQLARLQPGLIELRETAGIHQLYLLTPETSVIDPTLFLRGHYIKTTKQ